MAIHATESKGLVLRAGEFVDDVGEGIGSKEVQEAKWLGSGVQSHVFAITSNPHVYLETLSVSFFDFEIPVLDFTVTVILHEPDLIPLRTPRDALQNLDEDAETLTEIVEPVLTDNFA